MDSIKTIEHDGVIKKIDNNHIEVSIISKASCASCSVKGVCTASDVEEKIVEINDNSNDYKEGEHVTIYYKQSLGFRALFLGYILPFLILMVVLITLLQLNVNEAIAGVSALSTLIPYYISIYLLRNKLKETFSFSIIKHNKKDINFKDLIITNQ